MLEIKELDSWDEYERISKQTLIEEDYYWTPKYTIFRGQPNSNWELTTTLERAIGENMLVENYYRIITGMENKIETFTGQKWNLPKFEELNKQIKENHKLDDQVFNFLTYLRHFGFPTPLLDWTKSSLIAANFAFKDIAISALPNPPEKVAIYMCVFGLFDNTHIFVDDIPKISAIINSPRNNRRHELQQGIYTICLKEQDERIYFSNHEKLEKNDMYFPHITKFVIPASERLHALQALKMYNVNPYSLLGTEESLLESLFLDRYLNAQIQKSKLEDFEKKGIYERGKYDKDDINTIW